MAKKTRSVTFRCPEDVYQALSNFALDESITKDDKPIISEALVTALRIGLGLNEDVPTSNAVNKDALQQIQEQIDDLSNKLSNTVSKDELKEAIARLEVTEPAKKVSDTGTKSSLKPKAVPVAKTTSGILLLTKPEALTHAQKHGYTKADKGQSLYDWSKARTEAAIAKLAEFGLVPDRDGTKIAWRTL
jgi:hypothetical protein